MSTTREILLELHTKESKDGKRIFHKKKAKAVYEDYLRGIENNATEKSENEIWCDAVQGYKKGAVYGVGNAHNLFHETPRARSSSMQMQSYVPGIVSQLQEQLDAQRRADAARDEEVRKMKEQLDVMQAYFASCNPGFRPLNPDPKDLFGGGGSGASTSFPCS